MPNGVITIRRRALPNQFTPNWSQSNNRLAPVDVTATDKIEDIDPALQVDFANKYIVSDDDFP